MCPLDTGVEFPLSQGRFVRSCKYVVAILRPRLMNLLTFALLFVVSSLSTDLGFRRVGFPFVFFTAIPHSWPVGTERPPYSLIGLMNYPNLLLDAIAWYIAASLVTYIIVARFRSR